MMMGHWNYLQLSADSSLFPGVLHTSYQSSQSINFLSTSGVGIAPGFGFNLVWKKLFLGAQLFLGAEIQYQHYHLSRSDVWKSDLKLAPAEESKVSLGINGHKAFFALTVRNDFNNINFTDFRGQTKFTIATFDFGYRFNAPKPLEKFYEHASTFLGRLFSKLF